MPLLVFGAIAASKILFAEIGFALTYWIAQRNPTRWVFRQSKAVTLLHAAARSLYLARYTEAENYKTLLGIYTELLAEKRPSLAVSGPRSATASTGRNSFDDKLA